MKLFFTSIKIIGFIFCCWLYSRGFNLTSCILSYALILFTCFIEQKKSEADTSDS